MIAANDTGTSNGVAPFNASLWLSALTEAGGGYALASGRKLWLVVTHVPADTLTPLMAAIIGQPDRQEAVRSTIERRQIGETVS